MDTIRSNGKVSRWDGWSAGNMAVAANEETHKLSVVEDRIDRGIFYLHIMALHAKREQFGFGQGVDTVVFSSISFVFLPLLL